MAAPQKEAVHKLLTCSVCLGRFQHPKLLPCLHTFCLPCLERLVEGRTLSCPLCRDKTIVTGDGTSHFPINRYITDFMDLFPVGDARPKDEGAAIVSIAVPQQTVSLAASHRAATAMTQPQNLSRPLAVGGSDRADVAGVDNSPSINYQQKGRAVACFGEEGQGESQIRYPCGVAVSPLSDVIYMADSANHRVQVFDKTGIYVMTFGCEGRGDGQFDLPTGIAVNGSGQIIVSDSRNHRIQIFDGDGNFLRAFGTQGAGDGQLNTPRGVACDSMGYIYVCDVFNQRIQIFNSSGKYVRQFGPPDNDNYRPWGVAVSADNKVYVSDILRHRVHVFSLHGDFLFSFGSGGSGSARGQVKDPTGVVIDSEGFVVVGDAGNSRVQVFRADGRFYSSLGSAGGETGQFIMITGVAIMANGNLVVTDCVNHRLQIF